MEILVNNAGTVSDNKFENMTDDEWQRVVRVNLDSVFYMSKAVYPGMMGRGWGRIIQIGSMNGQAGQLNQVNYVAAKAGMHGFTKALAQEGAKYGITVNTVAPGYVDTYLMRNMPEKIVQKIVDKSPIRRMGHEEEVAHAVLFLVDDKGGVDHRLHDHNERRHPHVLSRTAAGCYDTRPCIRDVVRPQRLLPDPARPGRASNLWASRSA